jgi:hypothetical protein
MYDLEMSEEDAPMSIFARAGEHGYHFLKRNCGFIDADESKLPNSTSVISLFH